MATNAKTNNMSSALHAASQNGHIEVVNELIEGRRADLNLKTTNTGASALYIASNHGHTNIVEALLKANVNPNIMVTTANGNSFSALYAASENDHTGVVQALLNTKVDPNIMVTIATATGTNRFSALQAASLKGHDKIVEQLIIGGAAALDIPTTDGVTPLMLASYKGHVKVVEKLVEAGAQINLKDKDGTTALLEACKIKNLDIAKNIADYLFKNGADSKCLLSPGRLYGEKINSKLDGVSDEMKKKIYELADPKNIEKRDRALAAKTQISPSLKTHPITQEVLSPTSREGR